jgi:hypothetical protein
MKEEVVAVLTDLAESSQKGRKLVTHEAYRGFFFNIPLD